MSRRSLHTRTADAAGLHRWTPRIGAMSQPRLPAVHLRVCRGPADAEGMACVRSACAAVDGIDSRSIVQTTPTAAALELDLIVEQGFDPGQDLRVAEAGGRVVGYAGVRWWSESDGTRLFLTLGWVEPLWRNRGIGTELLHWAEGRCRKLARANPGPGPAFYGANASDTERDAARLLTNEGYRIFFTVLEMALEDWADLPDPTLPQGFHTRTVTTDDLPELFEAMNSSYADHPFSDVVHYETWATKQTDLSTWHVAWDSVSGRIAGQVQTLVRDGRTEVEEVSVRAAYRRRGLARALIAQGLLALREQGAELPRLRTLLENPQQAWRVYQSVGFRVVKRFPRYRKELVLDTSGR